MIDLGVLGNTTAGGGMKVARCKEWWHLECRIWANCNIWRTLYSV